MTNIKQIGFIGFGKMAEALASGFVKSARLKPDVIFFTEKKEDRSKEVVKMYRFTSLSLHDLIQTCDLIFVAIKPQQINELLPELKPGPIYVSLLAGTPISTFQNTLGPLPIIRIMPNTPALVSKGLFAITPSQEVSLEVMDFIQHLLGSLGKVLVVDEDKMDAITGISGSGPAFVYYLANVFMSIALENGFDQETARLLAAQTFLGASDMILNSSQPLSTLISDVRSKEGTTDAGLKCLEKSDIESTLSDAIRAAILRSQELG